MSKLSRRDCLALGTAAALMPLPAWAAAPDSLDALAKAKGFTGFGSCIGGSGTRPESSLNDPGVQRVMIRECGIVVPENELKWVALRPDAATFDFAKADRVFAFAEANGMAIRGHTLLWHHVRWMPDWLKAYDFGSAAAAEKMLRDHITAVCTRYGTRIVSYDVVNETLDDATGEMRDTPFTRYLGDKVIDIAFDAAHQAAPHAQLVYNDYMSWGAKPARHRAGVLRLLERLKENSVPVAALGVQAHISPDVSAPVSLGAADEAEWRRFLDAVTALDLDLLITEFDVGDQDLPADIAVRDAAAAELTRRYLDVMFSYKRLRTVMAWGMVDKWSWLRRLKPRTDGLPKRPSLYDDSYAPKPMREAFAAAFRAAPMRA